MKALFCTLCLDIRGLDPSGAWTVCRCGNLEARWLDPDRGTVRAKAREQGHVRFIGFNNTYLIGAAKGATHMDMVKAGGQWEWWRQLHDQATSAPGYIFDKDKRACWATIVKVGETSDIAWETEEKPAS